MVDMEWNEARSILMDHPRNLVGERDAAGNYPKRPVPSAGGTTGADPARADEQPPRSLIRCPDCGANHERRRDGNTIWCVRCGHPVGDSMREYAR